MQRLRRSSEKVIEKEIKRVILKYLRMYADLDILGIQLSSKKRGILNLIMLKELNEDNKNKILAKIKGVKEFFLKKQREQGRDNAIIIITCKSKPPKWLQDLAESEDIKIKINPKIKENRKRIISFQEVYKIFN